MRTAIAVGIALVVVAGLVAVALLFPTVERTKYSCPQCRLVRIESSSWYSTHSEEHPNTCSGWYASTFPDHTHTWRRHGCGSRRNPLSSSVAVICCSDCALNHIHPAEQLRFMQRTDRAQWGPLFKLLVSSDYEDIASAREMVWAVTIPDRRQGIQPARASDAASRSDGRDE